MRTVVAQANSLFRERRYNDALELYAKVLQESPAMADSIRFNMRLAEKYQAQARASLGSYRINAMHQLARNPDNPNLWESLGDDPHYLLEPRQFFPMQNSWYNLTLELHSEKAICPTKIYLDIGRGLNELDTVIFPVKSGEAASRIFWIESTPHALRFDPKEGKGEFRVETIRMDLLHEETAYLMMIKRLVDTNADFSSQTTEATWERIKEEAAKNSVNPLQHLYARYNESFKPRPLKLERPDNLNQYIFDQIKAVNLFDVNWYVAEYKDRNIHGNPLAHYLEHGVQQGLNPSTQFDTNYYLENNPDVAASGTHPFLHYVLQGIREGRVPLEPKFHFENPDFPIYVPLLDKPDLKEKAARLICFYLPQFHAIPENDKWWGEGFTEWSNVEPAQPQFVDHYQPHVPDELGYYNLTDTAVQRRQVELAKLYGVEGFCFYFYWFGGVRLLEKPIENYLHDKSLDLPFCLCWANENWSRRWDGLDSEILISQHHSPDDDLGFIEHVSQYMRDSRYIRIDGKPLLMVYRPSLLPSAKETTQRWRNWCRENGIGEIFLAYTQSFETVDPANYDFDAAIEFPPNNAAPPNITKKVTPITEDFAGTVYDWRALLERSKNYKTPEYKLFRGVNPSWDNTARRKNKGSILLHSSPCGYQQWLYNAIVDTRQRFDNADERLIFINAWNEWAEGAHLEPDQRYGYAWLESTRIAQTRAASPAEEKTDALAIVIHAFYEDVLSEILERLHEVKDVPFKLFVTTPHEKSEGVDAILRSSGLAYYLLPTNNRGRDVLPFMKIVGQIADEGYAYILKIHTKKSNHRKDGDVWRNDLYSKLVSENAMRTALNYFNDDDSLGVIGPSGHIVPMNFYWGSNAETVELLARRMGQTSGQIKELNFVAGTMFFARMSALAPLFNLAITEEDFEPEAGQIDGTLAHALERAIAISCAASAHVLTDTDMSQEQHIKAIKADYKFVSKS